MTTQEALKLIQQDIDDEKVDWDSPLGEAYKLSFEALKREQTWRKDNGFQSSDLLPRETNA